MTLDCVEDWVYTKVLPTQHIEMLNKSKWQQLLPYWAWKIARENPPALENKKELTAVPDAAQTPDVVKPHIQPGKETREQANLATTWWEEADTQVTSQNLESPILTRWRTVNSKLETMVRKLGTFQELCVEK